MERAHQKGRLTIHPVTNAVLEGRLAETLRALPLGSLQNIEDAMKRLHLPEENVAEKVIRVAHEVSEYLHSQGIPHALIGGLAVGVHGYGRATRDVDFLVHSSARANVSGKLLGAGAQGVTAKHKGVVVDFLFPDDHEGFLDDAVEHADEADGVPVISPPVLVYLKMKVARRKDQHDIRELIQSGKLDVHRAETYLSRHHPDLVEDFRSIVYEADLEGD